MNLGPSDIAALILKALPIKPVETFTAFAPVNIALCKYWGKRNHALNLPVNDSLSVSLGHLGSKTTVHINSSAETNVVYLNGNSVHADSVFYQRVQKHINLFKPYLPPCTINIETHNNIATAAGIASSASGFAALTKALAGVAGLKLSSSQLSILARLGSGSACRSIERGFVHWRKGNTKDGMDSYGQQINKPWPNLCIGLLTITDNEKSISSRVGMANTVNHCRLYESWPTQAEQDLNALLIAIEAQDFIGLGEVAEHNALTMHATMIATQPPLLYWQPETLCAIKKIWQLRQEGLAVYFTMDAGPNLKLLFQQKDSKTVTRSFSEIQTIMPFSEIRTE